MFLNFFPNTEPLPEKGHFSCKVFVFDDKVIVDGTTVAVVWRRRPVLNFNNILRAAFMPVDHKSVKRYWQFNWILALLGATGVKAACRSMMKLTPSVDLNNILWGAFTPVDPKSVKRYWQFDWILMLLGATSVKAACRQCWAR